MFLFLFVLSVTISTKLLVFDVFKIPSSSMENVLYSGDLIVVNKLEYGPRLPQSPFEIPWVNKLFYMNDNARSRINKSWWDYCRWTGVTQIKRGDVFVFNSTWRKDFILVKRCVGISGDTIEIKKGEIYTNSNLFNSPETVKSNYSFKIRNKRMLDKIVDSLKVENSVNYNYKKPNKGNAVFSKKELDFIKKRKFIDSVDKNIDLYDASQNKLLKTPTSKWTLDDMGPIIIPQKGMEIILNSENFMLYNSIIKLFEKNEIIENEGVYFINGKKVKSYRFKLNYYFMMGDNRKETSDSRCWGFLPEMNIVGKVQCVLVSNKNDKFQWRRIMKKI